MALRARLRANAFHVFAGNYPKLNIIGTKAFSGQRSAVSLVAQALALAFWPFGHATRTATRARLATLCERGWDFTQIQKFRSFLIAHKHIN
ncbi:MULTISPECIES: hypothetical protein [unclassified Moorena]|uniref:hypothetical protein n=1 Tax=unclassified Moorena TaxID=2683338 RepID=UPI0013B990DE|nr:MULTISPECIES: hypothetical protein [unclassified Moorena]NEQ15492.1 hypothetical protein [Moorena sp. SIO3E2]NER91041.1 hypothetical protein [Moorena sp. SIO3A2]NES40591.1 hypothetical protein [Moorena sp. SIO2C4]